MNFLALLLLEERRSILLGHKENEFCIIGKIDSLPLQSSIGMFGLKTK